MYVCATAMRAKRASVDSQHISAVMGFFLLIFFSVRLLLVLIGHSVFSSPPQRLNFKSHLQNIEKVYQCMLLSCLQITEGAETFTLTLKDPQGGPVIGTNSTCSIVIVANDFPIAFDSK